MASLVPLLHRALTSPVLGAVVALGITYLTYTRYTLHMKQKAFATASGCEAPIRYPSKDPVFALDWIYALVQNAKQKKMLEWFNSLLQANPTFSVFSMVNASIWTCDSENIKTLAATNFDDWEVEKPRSPAQILMGQGIFTKDGAFWAHSRAMLRPCFVKDQIADLDLLEKHTQALLKAIPTDGATVDLQVLFHRFSMDTSTEFLFGSSTNSLDPNRAAYEGMLATNVDDALEAVFTAAKYGPLRYFYQSNGPAAAKAARKAMDGFVKEAISAQSKTEETGDANGGYILLHELIRQTQDPTRILDECMNVLVAGRDTTASLLSLLWFQLARRPDIWEKLQGEVDELNGDLPTYQRLRDMKYLKYCTNETLRLFPSVPFVPKMALKDTTLPHGGGKDGKSPMFVAKGTRIQYSMWALHRNKVVYGEDADEFKPERWADSSLRPGWNFLPFGGGPRACLGQQFALTETYYVTIRLMQIFRRIEARGPEEFFENVTLVLSCGPGTQVSLLRT